MAARQLATDVEKTEIGNPANQPASGTYGDKASVERLADALPDPTEGAPTDPTAGGGDLPPVDASGVTNARSNREAAGMPGLPAPILAPTNRPDSPAGATPLRGPGDAATVTPRQQRLAMLDLLANSSEVSEETREWAQLVIRILTE